MSLWLSEMLMSRRYPPGSPFGFKCYLVNARQVADRIPPQFDDFVGRHVALIGRLHHDLDIDE